MSETNIRKALYEALAIALPGFVIHSENTEFSPDGADPWVQVSYLPAQPSPATLGSSGQDGIVGIMQVDLNLANGAGTAQLEGLVDALRLFFTAGKIFAYDNQEVVITSCGRGAAFHVDSYLRMPVSVIWNSRIDRTLT